MKTTSNPSVDGIRLDFLRGYMRVYLSFQSLGSKHTSKLQQESLILFTEALKILLNAWFLFKIWDFGENYILQGKLVDYIGFYHMDSF